jgi:hypothetical protein
LGLSAALRLGLSANGYGTEDALLWSSFARHIDEFGVRAVYRDTTLFNHPLLMALYAGWAAKLARATGLGFLFVFRLLPIAGDLLATGVLGRQDRVAGWTFGLAPCAILVSALHTNTDPAYGALLLLGAIALGSGRDVRAGLLFGAAVNVKVLALAVIAPVLLALPLGRVWRVGFGMSPWAIPFLALGAMVPGAMRSNVLNYAGVVNFWGLGDGLLTALYASGLPHDEVRRIAEGVAGVWRLPLVGVMVWGGGGGGGGGGRGVELAAAAAATFLAFTAGFGMQYCALLTPLIVGASRRWGLAWCVACSAFLISAYASAWDGSWPIPLVRCGYFARFPVPLVSCLPWGVALAYSVSQMWRPGLGVEAAPPK